MDRINDVGLKVESIWILIRNFICKEIIPYAVGAIAFTVFILFSVVEGEFTFRCIFMGFVLLVIGALLSAFYYRYEEELDEPE